jgi:integrase
MKPNVYPRGPGHWAIVVELPKGEDGKRRQKTKRVRGGKKEAYALAVKMMEEINSGRYIEPAKITLGQWFERWIRDYITISVSAGTLRSYKLAGETWGEKLGTVPLGKLTPSLIQRALTEIIDGGLCASTTKVRLTVLKMCLKQAVASELLARNPADNIKPPRVARRPPRVLTAEELGSLLSGLKGSAYFVPVYLAAATGMRRGEVLGLKWSSVDLEKGRLYVKEVLGQDGIVKEPKTPGSCRQVTLAEDTIAVLSAERKRQVAERLALGPAWQDNDLVCCREDGTYMSASALTTWFRYHARRLGYNLHFHGLRHTHATLLIEAGVNYKVVAERLGHVTPNITLSTYTSVTPTMQQDAVRRLGSLLANG